MAGPAPIDPTGHDAAPARFRPVPPRPQGDPGGDAGRASGPPRRSPFETALDVVVGGGRLRPLLVWHLFWGPRAFGELLRLTAGATKKVLRQELQALEGNGLLSKEQRTRDGRRAEYRLTPFGETLKPALGSLYAWGLYVQKSRGSAFGSADGPRRPADGTDTRTERARARSAARAYLRSLKEKP